MKAMTHGVLDYGFNGIIAYIECHLSNGLPNIIVVGFVNKAIDESKERIRSAFANSSIKLPKKRITINIAPADIPKDGTSLDLGIAASILVASEQIPPVPTNTILIGELGLDGSVRAVRGIIGKIMAGKKFGKTNFIIPKNNLKQALLVPGIQVYPVETLYQLYKHLSNTQPIKAVSPTKMINNSPAHTHAQDFKHIIGQLNAKRGLEIAASGGHNILLNGPPGTGKSMLAKATISILPVLKTDEALEVTHIHSLINNNFEDIVNTRPFRAPHHTASNTAIVGGGKNPRPGEISLSHKGVLFFDELPEFNRSTLEALRQPLEDGIITVSRVKDSITFPADFMLIATANPCPCGYFNTHRECSCSVQQILRYQRKLSGPILDRIDLFTEVENIEHDQLLSKNSDADSSVIISERVHEARKLQYNRFGATKTNNNMDSHDVKNYACLTSQATNLLNIAANKLKISPRSYMRTIKVARTIADLDKSEQIDQKHITEALQYRPKKSQIL